MRASLSKVQAFKFILQNAASKMRLFQTSIFKFYLLSPISALLLPTFQLQVFKNLLKKSENISKEFDSFSKNEIGAFILSNFFFLKKKCFVS
eukprot:UN20931